MKKSYYKKSTYLSKEAVNYSKKASLLMYKLLENELNGCKTLLDLGCGNAVLSKLISEKSPIEVTAVDFSQIAVKQAKQIGLRAKRVDLQKRFPFRDESYDVIYSGQVVEHLLNPDFFISECYRVLKKGGKLILTTPNLVAWFNRIIFPLGIQPFFTEVSTRDKTIGLSFTRSLTLNREAVGHIRVFTPGALKDLLSLYKFTPKTHRGYSGGFFPPLMQQFDSLISHLPNFASNIYMLAIKE